MERTASKIAYQLTTYAEAIRMVSDLAMASRDAQAQIFAALIHASALEDLADAIRSTGGDIEAGLQALAPAPSATTEAPDADPGASEGWITDRAPEEEDADARGASDPLVHPQRLGPKL